ncbi:MAG: D-alanyl-D-alanine carboxypeptidase [Clostridiales bacterium]|nr:D-alanyl-D-alanine carboxypeptidase [Clostridiales bacterium]
MNIFKKVLSFIIAIIIFVYMQNPPMANGEEYQQSAITTDNEVSQFTGNISAASAILINAETSEILYAKNENERRAMASTTKIMSAILTIEAGELDKKFTVDDYAINVEGTSMGLKKGDIVTRLALVQGMLLPSGNDAANAAAVNVSGSIGKFIDMMNNKAQELKLNDTNFVTATGLDAQNHYTTASDLAKLTAYALKNPIFKEICSKQSLKSEFGNPVSPRWLKNSNKLLSSYEGAIGVKTGFTDNARRCLVSAAKRNGITLIAVTLNAPDDWNDHKNMLDFGFSQYEKIKVIFSDSSITVPVVGAEQEFVNIAVDTSLEVNVQKQYKEQIRTKLLLPKFVYAGFDEGKEIGTIQYITNGKIIAQFPIKTAQAISVSENKMGIWDKILKFIGIR